MGKKPKRKNLKPPGKCIFCGERPLSKEHIWSDWLQQILPRQALRAEGTTEMFDTQGVLLPPTQRVIQGDVGTKKVKVVCIECNNTWMSRIVEEAKRYAPKLISGEQMQLDPVGQRAIANWIGLSALMANQITKARHKLPKSDVDHFYKMHASPPHWFIGIGYFVGNPGISFNHAHIATSLQDRNGTVSTDFVKHSFAAIIGHLFTLVDVSDQPDHPLAQFPVALVYRPNIANIQPSSPGVDIPFPPPGACTIHGPEHFWPGSQAYEVTTGSFRDGRRPPRRGREAAQLSDGFFFARLSAIYRLPKKAGIHPRRASLRRFFAARKTHAPLYLVPICVSRIVAQDRITAAR
jgi:hypothetical protein